MRREHDRLSTFIPQERKKKKRQRKSYFKLFLHNERDRYRQEMSGTYFKLFLKLTPNNFYLYVDLS